MKLTLPQINETWSFIVDFASGEETLYDTILSLTEKVYEILKSENNQKTILPKSGVYQRMIYSKFKPGLQNF